eukprot:gnl/Spiro4/17877_TR9519_c0_g1_i1.p2 gnl/Spiro4/17877_TR9519_c0_g1~~gnl/Spiro4/17877_TR9519_c0_g1_i1.p2  ORF type:complete len:190 (+),score=59.31 gnl/Spiro4/17877_TR9519_c0_g1_i1:57-626(+)
MMAAATPNALSRWRTEHEQRLDDKRALSYAEKQRKAAAAAEEAQKFFNNRARANAARLADLRAKETELAEREARRLQELNQPPKVWASAWELIQPGVGVVTPAEDLARMRTLIRVLGTGQTTPAPAPAAAAPSPAAATAPSASTATAPRAAPSAPSSAGSPFEFPSSTSAKAPAPSAPASSDPLDLFSN